MKKQLLFISLFLISVYSYSQCNSDYDFGVDVEFGVSPNPSAGEEFEPGVVGVDYSDVIHILVPTDAGDINESFAGYIIDSLELTGISIQIGAENLPISSIGLDVQCNNNGDSPNPCLFLGGSQYCATISGVPTQAGDYPLTINVTGYLLVFGTSSSIPYFFDQYVLHVSEDGPISISESENLPSLEVRQNVPNPFKNSTTIEYLTNQNGYVDFVVRNLLGEIIISKKIRAKKGVNSFKLNTDDLNAGIYMYSMDVNGVKVTKRMVVNK